MRALAFVLAFALSGCVSLTDSACRLPVVHVDANALLTQARAALSAQRFADAVTLSARALAAENPRLRARALTGDPPDRIFDAGERADLPALLLYAEALYRFADRRGAPTLVDEQDRIRAAATRAFEIDRTAEDGLPDRLLGLLCATLPNGYGDDPSCAVEHFEAAIAEAPGFLPNRLDYALAYAGPSGDRALYRKLLEQVARADPRLVPERAEENRRARAQAERLLAEEEAGP